MNQILPFSLKKFGLKIKKINKVIQENNNFILECPDDVGDNLKNSKNEENLRKSKNEIKSLLNDDNLDNKEEEEEELSISINKEVSNVILNKKDNTNEKLEEIFPLNKEKELDSTTITEEQDKKLLSYLISMMKKEKIEIIIQKVFNFFSKIFEKNTLMFNIVEDIVKDEIINSRVKEIYTKRIQEEKEKMLIKNQNEKEEKDFAWYQNIWNDLTENISKMFNFAKSNIFNNLISAYYYLIFLENY
jgi:hypothetical protein